AAAPRRLAFGAAPLIAPLHDPVRIAEDLAVLDVISGGRLVPMLSGGYVASEFAMFGRALDQRAQYMDEIVPFLTRAWTGEPFEWQGGGLRGSPRHVPRPRPP